MFTGIIQRIGTLKRISRSRSLVVEIAFDKWDTPLEHGESISVNGVCLTVSIFDETHFTADVLKETELRSTIGALLPGAKVNLERAIKSGGRFGGHIVQGHVDMRGKIIAIEPKNRDRRYRIYTGVVFASQCILKGSVAVDGVSLTITELGNDFIAVDLIPTTLSETVLADRKIGSEVNLEADVIGKYASRRTPGGTLTIETLQNAGFI
jgi:riboflavin synthase